MDDAWPCDIEPDKQDILRCLEVGNFLYWLDLPKTLRYDRRQ